MSDELWNWSKCLPKIDADIFKALAAPDWQVMNGYPGSSMPDSKPEDKTKKNYRLVRTSGYWQLWLSLKSGDQKWLTDREVSGESGKTFAEAWFDADIRFKPSGADD